jgi:hypothetical protein
MGGLFKRAWIRVIEFSWIAAHDHDVGKTCCRKGAQLSVQDGLAGYADHALGNVLRLGTQAPAAASRDDDDCERLDQLPVARRCDVVLLLRRTRLFLGQVVGIVHHGLPG